MRLGAAILAAGSSIRFGSGDKLTVDFRGRMVGEHAAIAIPVDRFAATWVVTAASHHPCEKAWRAGGFTPLRNAKAAQGLGTSVAHAARAATEAALDGLLITLADMPLVPRSHFDALIECCEGGDSVCVSAIGTARMPPAIFGSAHFDALAKLTGDTGARALLGQGQIIACPPEWLKDIDTVADL